MSQNEIIQIIANAISTALIDYPNTGEGTQWAQQAMDPKEAQHRAMAVIRGLDKAGLTVTKKSS